MRIQHIRCAFCGGKGRDPFGIPSALSLCVVCGGRGSVWVAAPYLRCAHCGGSGAIKTFTCTCCGGKGFVPAIDGSSLRCAVCGGSGDDPSVAALPCLNCHGRGRVVAA